MDATLDKIRCALDRTVPIADPTYIVGEEDAIEKLNRLFKSSKMREQGFLGCVILGQVGNGKTHFLRHLRYYCKDSEVYDCIAIYVPDMFVSGPLIDSLNGIYKSLFNGPGNKLLKAYLSEWKIYKNVNKTNEIQNNIMKNLSLCINEDEEELIMDYYSGIDLIPDQSKYLRNKYGLKKKLINNENDFCQYIKEALEFLTYVSGKNILLTFDEIDKIYSYDTNKVTLSKVQTKILTAYRSLFDCLNAAQINGIIAIGATPEAWDILGTQGAFERRFRDNTIILKVPKSKQDCIQFIKRRFDEMKMVFTDTDKEISENIIESMPENKRRTWAEVIHNVKNYSQKITENNEVDPSFEIINVLNNAFTPLTWNEIIDDSELLKKIYPKSQPTTLLKKLERENKIIISNTTPKTYESINYD